MKWLTSCDATETAEGQRRRTQALREMSFRMSSRMPYPGLVVLWGLRSLGLLPKWLYSAAIPVPKKPRQISSDWSGWSLPVTTLGDSCASLRSLEHAVLVRYQPFSRPIRRVKSARGLSKHLSRATRHQPEVPRIARQGRLRRHLRQWLFPLQTAEMQHRRYA